MSEQPEIIKDQEMTGGLVDETFINRLNTTFQDQLVNVEFESFEGNSIKKVVGAVLTKISDNPAYNYIELSSANPLIPFSVLTFITGVSVPVNVEFVKSIIIQDTRRIISVEKA